VSPHREAAATGLTTRSGPRLWLKTVREIVTLERMHRAFACGLMTYGMIKAKKPAA
jgi:MPBQ/MSBQ methyltransferase